MRHVEVVTVLLILGILLFSYSLFTQSIASGLTIKNGIEIAVNGNPDQSSVDFVATSFGKDDVSSFYQLNTEENDRVDIKYEKQTDSSSELYFYSFPGSEDSFTFSQRQKASEKIDDVLLDASFLSNENYIKDSRVSVIINLASYPGIEFEVVRNSFVNELESFLDLSYYRIKDLDIVDSVSMDIELEYLDSIADLSMVKKIELDRKVQVVLDKSVSLIKAPDVWLLNDSNGNLLTGKNVTIAIIDTGVDYTHSDLGGCFGFQCKVVGGWDFINGDADPIDDHGHGTHVAATAAGNGVLKGVAPDAKIYAYKVLSSSGSGSWSQVISGIRRATDPNNDGNTSDHVDIISMSLGGTGNEDSSIAKAVDEAVDVGVVVISAAGNSGTSSNALGVPAAARKGIAVAATDDNDKLAYFSSRGPTALGNLKPDVSGPGVSICAAQWDNAWNSNKCLDEKHTSISGTSMATPHISGVAALLLQNNPGWEPIDVKSALMSTSKDLGLKVLEQGAGRVDSLEVIKAAIATSPASLSFGQVFENSFSANLEIKNNGQENVDVSISVGDAIDEKKVIHSDIVSSNKKKIKLNPGETDTIQVSVSLLNDLDGGFYGYLTLSSEGKDYRVPYYFIKKSKLFVEVVNDSKALKPSIIAVRSSDMSVREQGSFLWDYSGNKHSFTLRAGNYTIYSLGDYSDKKTMYILSKSIILGSGESETVVLDLADAVPYQVSTESFEGDPLYLKDLSYGIMDTFNQKVLRLSKSMANIDPSNDEKSQTIYISDFPENPVNQNILISFIGYPKRENIPSVSYSTRNSETAGGTDSMYLLYWILDASGMKNLTFSKDEMGVYNYIHNLPGGDPNQGSADFGNNYKTTDRWVSKYLTPTINFYEKPALPRERTVYIKAGNYTYKQISNINYIHFNSRYDESAATIAQYELDNGVNSYYYTGVVAKPGEKRTIYHGTTPLIPTHFKNKQNIVILDPLLQTKDKGGYIYKTSKITYVTPSGASAVYTLQPRILVYKNNNPVYNLTPSWDGYTISSYDTGNPRYKVIVDIPSFYEIQTKNTVTSEFTLRSADINPPYLDSMDISPYFVKGEPFNIIFTLKDDQKDNEDVSVSAYYKEGDDWNEIQLEREDSVYIGSIVPTGASIDLKVVASDGDNTIEYVMEPISKEGIDIDLDFTTATKRVDAGDTITFTGKVNEELSNEPIIQALVKYFISGNFFDFSRSNLASGGAGSILTKWVTNTSYIGIYDEFVASYAGTGIYKPKEETMKISFNVPGPDLLDLWVNDSTVNSKWDSASEVIFKSDYDGDWKEYPTEYSLGVFSYTIPVNDTVGWKFEAKDSSGTWNKMMRERILDLSLPETPPQNDTPENITQPEPEPQLNITTVSLVSFDNNKGWGEKWNFVCSVSNTNGNSLLAKLLAKPSGGQWETKAIQSVTNTKSAKNVSFSILFDSSLIGANSIKCQALDGDVLNETSEQQVNVVQDDVSLVVWSDKNSVQRAGKDSIKLFLSVFDIDVGKDITDKIDGTIKVSKDGDSFTDYSCKFDSDKCIVSINPDNSFSVGNRTFEGSISNSEYKISSSGNWSFSVIGSFDVKLKGGKKVKTGESVNLEVEIKDDTGKKTDPDTVDIFFRPSLSVGSLRLCQTTKTDKGEYSCVIDTSHILSGQYNVRISATKVPEYLPFIHDYKEVFSVKETIFKKHKFNVTDRKSDFKIPEINSSFKFRFKKNIEPPEINFTLNSENPVAKNFTKLSPLDKYLRIEPPVGLNENLTEVEIKIDYADDEVSAKNFDEKSLRISFYNETSEEWVGLDGGVNTTGNYVWANVTHLSDFGVGGKLEDGSSCDLNDQCSSDNCASDFDGSGSWCAPSTNCAAESLINYISGSTTCYNDNQQTCSSGSWSETACSSGCSAGLCIVPTPPPSAPSGGSGGGGGGSSSSSVTITRECIESDYTCSQWSECEEGKQQRLCSRITGEVCSDGTKPIETQNCGKIVSEDNIERFIEAPLNEIVVGTKKIPQADDKTRKMISITAAILILIALFIVLWQKVE